jgi:DNA gyrase/topoisomerase IV subunit A
MIWTGHVGQIHSVRQWSGISNPSYSHQAILSRESEVRAMGSQTGGVNGMDLAKGDYLVSMDAVCR